MKAQRQVTVTGYRLKKMSPTSIIKYSSLDKSQKVVARMVFDLRGEDRSSIVLSREDVAGNDYCDGLMGKDILDSSSFLAAHFIPLDILAN